MEQQPVLIATIAIGLCAAFVGGMVAKRLRLPPIVGYLLAGIAIGPYTPGLIADSHLAVELAEIGVILLMFGVGIHFSIKDLLAVRNVAIPGAIGQIAVATLLGTVLGVAMGWGIGGGLVLGLALSVASTVVLLRALEHRRELTTSQGRIAVGWLIVEDVFTVLVLVLLPTLAPLLSGAVEGAALADVVGGLALAAGKAVIFGVVIVVVGARLVPWLLVTVARDGSRELFTLGVLAVALGIAFLSSSVFGISLALGAFLAGVVVGESDVSHQAAADALPLRDAFAVLFFVSVGMLVDPAFLLAHPLEIAAVVALVVVAKSVAAFVIVAVLGHPLRTALTVAAALSQIGEFSFILATLGLSLGLLPPEGLQLIVAGAVISITTNPALFAAVGPLERLFQHQPRFRALVEGRGGHLRSLADAVDGEPHPVLAGHAVLAGYGRVARIIAPVLERRGFRFVIISNDRRAVERLRAHGQRAIYGDASNPDLLEEAGIARARLLVSAVNDAHATALIVQRARELNPGLRVVARTGSDEDALQLHARGTGVEAIVGDRELAIQMLRSALRRYGVSVHEIELIAQGVRGRKAAAAHRPSRGLREGVTASPDRKHWARAALRRLASRRRRSSAVC